MTELRLKDIRLKKVRMVLAAPFFAIGMGIVLVAAVILGDQHVGWMGR